MNSQIIDELEIIINAQVEGARKQIKDFKKDMDDLTNSVSKDFKQMNKDGNLDPVVQKLKEIRSDLSKFDFKLDLSKIDLSELEKSKETLEKLQKDLIQFGTIEGTIFSGGEDHEYIDLLMDKILEYQDAIQDAKAELTNMSGPPADVNQTAAKVVSNTTSTTTIDADTSGMKNGVISAKNEIDELLIKVGKLEKQNINPMMALPLKEAFTLLKYEIKSTFPEIDTMKLKVSELGVKLSNSFNNSAVGNKINSISQKINEFGNNAKNKFTKVKDSISNSIPDSVKKRVSSIGVILKDVSSLGVRGFNALKAKIKNIGSETDKAKKKFKGFGNGMNMNGLAKSFSNGIASIKKFALSLLSVRTAFSAVSRASQAYLQYDTQLQASIQNSWNVLGSLLAPALEFVAGLFSKLVSVVAQFVQQLTGIDFVARANSKALDKQAKSAQTASKSLSSIDDISSLSSSSGGGGSEPQTITTEPVDMGPVNDFVAQAKELLSTLFEPIGSAWEETSTGLFDSTLSTVESLGGLGNSVFGSLMEVWTNGTGQEMVTNTLLGIQQIIDIVGGLAKAFDNAWKNADSGTKIIQSISNIFKDVQKFGLSIGDSIKKWVVSEGFQEALNGIFEFLADISELAEDICDWILKMYEKYFKPVIDEKLLPAITDIITAISDIWKAVKPVVDKCVEIIGKVLEPVIKRLTGIIGGIIDIIAGIAKFISGVFTGDWEKAWEGIKQIFSGIWQSLSNLIAEPVNLILATIETFVNAMIKGVNFIIGALNKIKVTAPDWVTELTGIKSFGFNIKKAEEITLPRLASGQIAYEEQQVVIGEYANAKHDPEIVSPVSMMEETFNRALRNNNNNTGQTFERLVINVAGRNFFDETIEYINEETARRGVSVIKEA